MADVFKLIKLADLFLKLANPYEIKERKGKFLVINKETGKVKGTHDTRKDAISHLRALYANVKD